MHCFFGNLHDDKICSRSSIFCPTSFWSVAYDNGARKGPKYLLSTCSQTFFRMMWTKRFSSLNHAMSPLATWTRKPVPRPRATIEGLATKIRCDYTCLLLQMRDVRYTAAPSPLATEVNVWYELFVLVAMPIFSHSSLCLRTKLKVLQNLRC